MYDKNNLNLLKYNVGLTSVNKIICAQPDKYNI